MTANSNKLNSKTADYIKLNITITGEQQSFSNIIAYQYRVQSHKCGTRPVTDIQYGTKGNIIQILTILHGITKGQKQILQKCNIEDQFTSNMEVSLTNTDTVIV